MINLKIYIFFIGKLYSYIAGKELVVSGNISIANRSFRTLIKGVNKYLQVFLSRIFNLLYIFSSTLKSGGKG